MGDVRPPLCSPTPDQVSSKTASSTIVYGVDERPPLGRSVVYAFQHIFAMILGSITGGVIISESVGLDATDTGRLIGFINIAVGIATIIQVSVGVRLPLIQGSTSGHLPAYLALGSVGGALFADAYTTMQYLMGALLVGALLEAAFGLSNALRWVFRYVSPMTIGVVIMMVGLGLWPVVADFIGGGWPYAGAVIALVMVFSFAFGVTVKTMALFLAVISAYTIAAVLTALGVLSEGHGLYVDFTPIRDSAWITVPEPFPWGTPKFNPGFILAMSIPYVATIFESLGDYVAVAESSDVERPQTKRLSRGITSEGIASAISSVLGGTATSSFSQNVGVVRLSGVASRFVCILAGVFLICLGLFAKFGAIFGALPELILGSVYLVAFGILVMTGLRLVMQADIKSSRNETILGSALLLGLALPAYMRDNPIETGEPSLQIFFNVFLATPMIVSGVWVFLLDNIIPGSPDERGMTNWLDAETSSSGSKQLAAEPQSANQSEPDAAF